MVSQNVLTLKYYYLFNLVQQLSYLKAADRLSDTVSIIRSLLAFAAENSKSEEERRRWKVLMNELASIELQLKLVEQEVKELESEIFLGNILNIPKEIEEKYSRLVTRLDEIEALVLNRVDDLLGGGIPIQVTIPQNSIKINKRKKKKEEVVDDDIEDFLA